MLPPPETRLTAGRFNIWPKMWGPEPETIPLMPADCFYIHDFLWDEGSDKSRFAAMCFVIAARFALSPKELSKFSISNELSSDSDLRDQAKYYTEEIRGVSSRLIASRIRKGAIKAGYYGVTGLSPKYGKILELHKMGLSTKDIAVGLNMPETTIYSLKQKLGIGFGTWR